MGSSISLIHTLSDISTCFTGGKQKRRFKDLIQVATISPTPKFYDVNNPIMLSVDASSEGTRAVVLQDEQPVAYGSGALTDSQHRYE